MNAAGLVVNVEHAAADHHGNEHRQRDRARKQKLHIFDVGIEFDNLQRRFLQETGSTAGLFSAAVAGERILKGRTHEVVAVVHNQCDLGRSFRIPGVSTAEE